MWDILMSNLALSEYYSQYKHPTMCDIVRVYQFRKISSFFSFLKNFLFDKGVSDKNIWKGSVWCEWHAPLPPVFHSSSSSRCTSVKRRQRPAIHGSCPAGKNHTFSVIFHWCRNSLNSFLKWKSWTWAAADQVPFEVFVNAPCTERIVASFRSKCCISLFS